MKPIKTCPICKTVIKQLKHSTICGCGNKITLKKVG